MRLAASGGEERVFAKGSVCDGESAGERRRDRDGRVDRVRLLYRAGLIAFPLLLIALNDTWLYPTPGWVDPWIYTGYHLHLVDLSRAFPDVYYETRLPWNLFGWMVHQIAGPATALHVLRLAVFYAATFSLFVAIDLIFASPLAGFIAACLLGADSWFLWAIGWDYVDGPTIACFLMSFAALAGAACGERWRAAALLWGAATAATFTLFLAMIVFLPIEILVFLLIARIERRRCVPAIAALAVVGAAGAMLVMGVVNWRLGSNFLYLLPQITAVSQVSGNRFRRVLGLGQWIWAAPWLLVSAFAAIASLALIAGGGRDLVQTLLRPAADALSRDRAKMLVLCLGCAAGVGGYAVLEAMHYHTLLIFYRANPLLPLDYLAIGAVFAVATAQSSQRQRAALALLAFGLGLAPWLLNKAGLSLLLGQPPRTEYLTPPPTLLPAAQSIVSGPFLETAWVVVGAGLLVGVAKWRRFVLSAATLGFLSVAGVAAISDDHPATFPADGYSKDATLAILSASRFIGSYDGNARSRFWYGAKDRYALLYTSISSTYLYGYTLLNENFPELGDEAGAPSSVAPGERIVILAADGDDAVPRAEIALARRRLSLTVVARSHIRSGGIGFDLIVADLAKAAP